MKKEVVLLVSVLLFCIVPIVYSQQCDYFPLCNPLTRECGCGGLQKRFTLCDGGCSDWNECNVTDVETSCTDGADNDCDERTDCFDTDCAGDVNCVDADNDGYNAISDCSDTNPNINPGTQEICNNRDDNCNGKIDELLVRECGQSSIGVCTISEERCANGQWTGCAAVMPGTEVCDGLDNDCDGQLDEGCSCNEGEQRQCGTTDVGVCAYGQQICTGGTWEQCLGSVEPGTEVCGNNLDDDCDGQTDEGCDFEPEPSIEAPQPEAVPEPLPEPVAAEPIIPSRPCVDADGDGRGVNCVGGEDCNDQDPQIYFGAPEVCDGKDNNCNLRSDELLERNCGFTRGMCRTGTEQCRNGAWVGCDAVIPVDEVCNNYIDDDCDGQTDEGCPDIPGEKEEKLLKSFTDSEYGDDYDFNAVLESYRETRDNFIIKKESEVREGDTKITIRVKVKKPMKDVKIYELIPKKFAASTDEVEFNIMPSIIRKDPLVAWHFNELTEEQDLSYVVKGKHEDAYRETETLAISHKETSDELPRYMLMLPILIIPIAGTLFIILLQISKKYD